LQLASDDVPHLGKALVAAGNMFLLRGDYDRSSLKERAVSRGVMCPFFSRFPAGFQACRWRGRGQGWSARLDERP